MKTPTVLMYCLLLALFLLKIVAKAPYTADVGSRDRQAGFGSLNSTLASSAHNNDLTACLAKEAACMEDAACFYCLLSTSQTECPTKSISSCGGYLGWWCCHFGDEDSCMSNVALTAYMGMSTSVHV